MKDIPVWILTFNRPTALNRLIVKLRAQGFHDINVFSNSPRLEVEATKYMLNNVVINTLNCEESTSWCARAWNNILLKNFHKTKNKNIICLQDDTDISDNFGNWIREETKKYDFIWGPAGDQFFYTTFEMFKNAGYWDERYLGCYCGDADWLKRVFLTNDQKRIMVMDTHNWGFIHNFSIENPVNKYVITGQAARECEKQYVNQHTQLGNDTNTTLTHSQDHYWTKWGAYLDSNKPCVLDKDKTLRDIDWYPWFTKLYGVKYW